MIHLKALQHVKGSKVCTTDIQATFDVYGKTRKVTSSSKNPVLTENAWVCGLAMNEEGRFIELNVCGKVVTMEVGDFFNEETKEVIVTQKQHTRA